MTDSTVFTEAELNTLLRVPHWVVRAASMAQPDGSLRTAAENESGFITITHGRASGNAFVEELARLLVERDGEADPMTDEIDFTDAGAGIATVLRHVSDARQMLSAKASPADLTAYGSWLLTITDVVIRAARSGDVLGLGGSLVSDAEQRFRDDLLRAVRPLSR